MLATEYLQRCVDASDTDEKLGETRLVFWNVSDHLVLQHPIANSRLFGVGATIAMLPSMVRRLGRSFVKV